MFFDIIIFVVGFVIGFCVAKLIIFDKRIVDELAIIKFTLDNIFDWVKGISNKIDLLNATMLKAAGQSEELSDEEKEQIEIIEKLKRSTEKN